MLQLGTITYNIAKDWTLDEILKKLEALKFPGVELRTGHKHGVEVGLTPAQREEVKKKFDDSPVDLAGLGSAFEFQAAEPARVRENIEGTKAYVRLAHDIGSPGVKVRPNGLARGVEPEKTYEQIGKALKEVGQDAADFGVEIRVEVHGATTQLLPNFARIMAHADHPNVFACWNSNPSDVVGGTIKDNFALVAPEDSRGPPPRPDGRDLPLAGTLRPAVEVRIPGLHPRRDPREPRPRACPALLPISLDRVSALTLRRLRIPTKFSAERSTAGRPVHPAVSREQAARGNTHSRVIARRSFR